MAGLRGFKDLQLLSNNQIHQVYRATQLSDGRSVVIKTLDMLAQEREAVARLRHEYQLLSQHGSTELVYALDIQTQDQLEIMVLQDDGGVDLADYLNKHKLDSQSALKLMIQVTHALGQAHRYGIVHRDINPSNIILLRKENQSISGVKLIDFGVSVKQKDLRKDVGRVEKLVGNIKYIAPEQTGKMNRKVDSRADYYSLGATFYEVLLGRPPFVNLSDYELIHAHIAKRPIPPHEVDKKIPRQVSEIVMKLMAKNAEDRYLSTSGIEKDLERCLDEIGEDNYAAQRLEWALGEKDISSQFSIPQKLYGREVELQKLFRSLRKAQQGKKTLLLVDGVGGMGKTSLVRELQRPVLDGNGYIVFGKYDQLKRNVPYSGLVLALQQWVKQILSEPDDALQRWREELQKRCATNGALLTELIPDLELVIGIQPKLKKMDPIQHQTLLLMMFEQLIELVTLENRCFVLVLDDLQWADYGSFALLEACLCSEDITHLMIVGVYRGDEVDENHLLRGTVDLIKQQDVNVDEICLQSLPPRALCDLVLDTFSVEESRARDLSNTLFEKTKGNPFFVEEFLGNLVRDNAICFDFDRGRWDWDVKSIQQRSETLNVVELIAGRLHECPPHYLDVLQAAACEGMEFHISQLLSLQGVSGDVVVEVMGYGVESGLAKPVGEAYLLDQYIDDAEWIEQINPKYQFVHDHILKTIYDSCEPDKLLDIHKQIGINLLRRSSEADLPENVFSIVWHLNKSTELLETEADKRELVKLNKLAAEKAIEAGAFAYAESYLTVALGLFNSELWQDDYDFARAFWLKLTEVAYLVEDYDQADRYIEQFEERCRDNVDCMRFYHIKMHGFSRQGDMEKAVDFGIDKLSYVAESMPRHPSDFYVLRKLIYSKYFTWRHMKGKAIYDCPELMGKINEDRLSVSGADHLYEIGSHAFLIRKNLFACMILRAPVDLLTTGVNKASAGALAAYGLIHVSLLKKVDEGYAYAQYALKVAEVIDYDSSLISTMQLFNGFVRHWKDPLKDTLKPLLWVHRYSMEVANLEFAAHGANVYLLYRLFSGADLVELTEEAKKYQKILWKTGQKNLSLYPSMLHQLFDSLMNEKEGATEFEGQYFSIDRLGDTPLAEMDNNFIFYFHLFHLQYAYILGVEVDFDYHIDSIKDQISEAPGIFGQVVFMLYYPLVALLLYKKGVYSHSKAASIVKKYRKELAFWCRHCPQNIQNKLLIVEGCAHLLNEKWIDALSVFERAVSASKLQGFTSETALAFELCAEAAEKLNAPTASANYIREAAVCYQVWGAKQKVNQLKEQPLLEVKGSALSGSYSASTSAGASAKFDIAALRAALRNISEEKVHTRLVAKTIIAASQFAGSQKAILLLKHEDSLSIEATITSDMDEPEIMQSVPLSSAQMLLAEPVVNYVIRTLDSVVLDDAMSSSQQLVSMQKSPYVLSHKLRSVMALPLVEGAGKERQLIGVIYLENNMAPSAFTEGMVEALEIIGLAAAGRLELSRKAVTDGLTGLFNHDYFQQQLKEQIALCERHDSSLCLLMLDIDHFKSFNDSWGHQVGDLVLKEVARSIKVNCRTSDVVARYGGEEMAVILTDTDEAGALILAEKVRNAIFENTVFHEDNELSVTASIGLSCLGTNGAKPDVLIRTADEALYACKNAGRNQVIAASTLSRQ